MRYTSRPPVTGLFVAEAEHVIPTTGGKYLGQTGDERFTFSVFEDVEQPTIEDRVETLTKITETEGIRHDEPRIDAPLARFPLGQLYGFLRQVDPDGFVAQGRGKKSVFASAATDIEHPAHQLTLARQ